jgi:hypothetical protein
MDQQHIYEEALRRAGIMTSLTPLSSPGFPTTYGGYVELISTQNGINTVRRMVSSTSQLSRFEAEMHNLRCEQENQRTVAAAASVVVSRNEAEQNTLSSEYLLLKQDEIALFKKFKEEQDAKKREDEALEARKLALEVAAREEEKASAIQLFREFLKTTSDSWYSQSEVQIINTGKQIKECGPAPNDSGLVKMWREKRYRGKVEWHDYTHSICDGGWSPIKNGREWDGWPLADEADTEVRKLYDNEWKMYCNFCIRYIERERGDTLTNQIHNLETQVTTQKARIEELESKLAILRQAYQMI